MFLSAVRRAASVPSLQRVAIGAARLVHTDDLAALRKLVGDEHVLQDGIEAYTVDWTRSHVGGGAVCLPRTTMEVSAVLGFCNEQGIGVVPQGGNTSLVGGAVGRSQGDLILSMRRMNRIIDIDVSSRVLYCEAGCVLENLSQAVGAKHLLVPLDLGAKGSCMIGGNVSTNAGGVRVIRYGSMHANVLGLEVVLADGTVIDSLRGLRKDNCGFQTSHMFIGAEGTLGVVTKVALALHSKPAHSIVAMLRVSSFDKVTQLLNWFRNAFGDFLCAFEYIDSHSMFVTKQQSPNLLARFPHSLLSDACVVASDTGVDGAVFVLAELSAGFGTQVGPFTASLQDELGKLMSDELRLVDAAVLSESVEQAAQMWKLRESVPVCLMEASRGADSSGRGKLFKYDISMRPEEMSGFIAAVRRQCEACGLPVSRDACSAEGSDVLEICTFGHVGDGNMHLNILARILEKGRIGSHKKLLDNIVFSEVSQRRGSISAEHGIGQDKVEALFDQELRRGRVAVRSAAELALMRSLKQALDPKGIMNPGKVFPKLS